MRTFLRGKVTLLFMTLGLLLAVPAIALADDLRNNIDATFDANFETLSLEQGQVPADTETVNIVLQGQGSDGEGGCNVDSGEGPVTVKAVSSNSSVASVKWASTNTDTVNFTDCAAPNSKNLTVTAGSAGSANVTFEITNGTLNTTTGLYTVSATGSGTYDVSNARFTVNVTPPPNTPPTVSVTGVTHGAIYDKGSVPAAGCSVSDAEDTGESATPVTNSSALDSDGLGSETVTCSYTDGGGITVTASATYTIRDPSAPVIGHTLNPATPDGDNGWYKSDVTLTWNVSEPQSPNSLQKTGCVDQNITADQAATTYSCSASSSGGSAGPVDVTIKRDATEPSISGSASPAANSNGWNNSNVTVSYTCGDNLSGVASCGPDETLSSEGANQSSTGNARDNAGNTNSATVSGIKIDKTAPSVSLVGGPNDGSSHYFGSVPSAPTCNASDGLSGLDGSCSVSGYGTTVGSHTVTATAKDRAGNESTASSTYTVLAWTTKGFYQPVDMNGVFNTVKGGSTVPLKFELFAANELTDTASVKSLTYAQVNCDGSAPTDDIETVATGSTSLRYDSTAGQFVYNWKTPTGAGKCYKVTMTAQDGSTISAFFKMK